MQIDARTLTHADLNRLMRRALFAEELVERTLGRGLDGSASDLALLDELLERGLVTANDHYALSCLGVVIGSRFLEEVEGLTWAPLDPCRSAYPVMDPASGRVISPLAMLEARLTTDLTLSQLFQAVRADLRPDVRVASA